ncbi:MAG: hypothetical protein Q7U54_19005 [Bacteroidales bacterium]|nr:hypothetical protein [Bacteroidales bacterium]
MKTKIKVFLASVLALTLAISGCYYDNEEDLYLGSSACDTTNVTYLNTTSGELAIEKIFEHNCNSCHSGSTPSGNIKTDNYEAVKANIIRIRGAINHQSGFQAMPQGGSLSSCDLTKIDIWIRKGMLNN